MAMIYCGECGKRISDKAAACPHCGTKVYKPKTEVSEERGSSEVTCDECGNTVSDGTTICPHCGAPIEIKNNSINDTKTDSPTEQQPNDTADRTPAKKNPKKKGFIIKITAVFLVVTIVCIVAVPKLVVSGFFESKNITVTDFNTQTYEFDEFSITFLENTEFEVTYMDKANYGLQGVNYIAGSDIPRFEVPGFKNIRLFRAYVLDDIDERFKIEGQKEFSKNKNNKYKEIYSDEQNLVYTENIIDDKFYFRYMTFIENEKQYCFWLICKNEYADVNKDVFESFLNSIVVK